MAMLVKVAIASIAESLLINFFSGTKDETPSSRSGTAMLWIQLCFVQLVLLGLWNVLIYPNFLSPLRHLPGPKNNSLFMGQYYNISKRTLCEPYRDWIKNIPNDGIIRYKFILNTERLLLTSPKAISEVLVLKSYDFEKPIQLRQALGKIIGQGIILQEGEEHRHARKHMGAAFSSRHVKMLYPVFWTKARELTDELLRAIPRAPGSCSLRPGASIDVDVGEWAARATLDIIGIAVFGEDFGCIQDPRNELSTCYRDLRNLLLAETTPSIKMLLGMLFPGGDLRMVKGNNHGLGAGGVSVRRIAHDLVRKKRELLKEGRNSGVDILSIMLNEGAFTDDELVDQAMTLLMAGHETTAASITWAIYALCRYPEVQGRLHDEITRTFPAIKDARIVSEDMGRLPYLSAVCNEVLRLFPPGPRTIRIARDNTTVLGQPVPGGTPLVISPWAVNVGTALWGADAAEFSPERWLAPGQAQTGGASSNHGFLTFLAGPRGCLGSAFARGEFACILLAWVAAFHMQFADPDYQLEVSAGLTVRPKLGFTVRLTPVSGT